MPFTGELWIEQDDFREVPPPKYFRLSPGREVRLRGSYLVTAHDVVKDEASNIVEVRYSFDPESRGGTPADGRKVKSTMHWVSAPHALDATVALYDRLFTAEAPGERTGEAVWHGVRAVDERPGLLAGRRRRQIGRASCRERV